MHKKIKILRIIARLNIGGPVINAVLLTQGLNSDKFETLLVAGSISADEGDMSYLAYDKNIEPVIIPQLRREINPINDFTALCKIYKLILKFQPDIIHTHTAKAGTLGRISGLVFNFTHCRKIKLVHTFHGHVLNNYFSSITTNIFILIEKILAKFTDKLIIVSETLKNDILSLDIGNDEKIQVVRLGFELDKFFSIPPRESNSINIGIVGRLVPIKNHKMFFDAVKLLLNTMGNGQYAIRFFIIGDGELRGQLQGYVKQLGIDKEVEFMGWQTDLVKVYQDLDIVALTSLNEGTPVSLIEALASARAVIATNVGGVKDVIGARLYPKIADRGLLVESNDCKNFADGLKLLIFDADLRRKLGMSGREFIGERFDNKRLIKDVEILYNMISN